MNKIAELQDQVDRLTKELARMQAAQTEKAMEQERALRTDAVIAAKVVHDYEKEHTLERVLDADLKSYLHGEAEQYGYSSTETSLRVAFMARKYWNRMKMLKWD